MKVSSDDRKRKQLSRLESAINLKDTKSDFLLMRYLRGN
jgi:hypothetical protein